MKWEIARYVSECDTCRKVKANDMKPGGLFQPLSNPEWKWDDRSMYFTVGLSLTAHKFDSIWVIVDRLSKSAHFIPVNTNKKCSEVCIDLHSSCGMLARSFEDNHLLSRATVCL
jgi:hypothetical protein